MAKHDLKPVHPGKILFEEFMKPLNLSQYRLAKELRISPMRINQIIHGTRAITADTAIRLACLLNRDAEFWMNLQSQYDLEIALLESYDKIRKTIKPLNPKQDKPLVTAKKRKTASQKSPHIAARYASKAKSNKSSEALPDLSNLLKKIDRFASNFTVDKKPRK